MRIKLHSVFVDDEEKALKSCTEVLGFIKKMEIPLGDAIMAGRRLPRRARRYGVRS